jgi:hypothetical protein
MPELSPLAEIIDGRGGDVERSRGHPEHERFSVRHRDHGPGFVRVDAAKMGELLAGVGMIEVDTGMRRLAGRPVIGVTARRRDLAKECRPAPTRSPRAPLA